MPASTPPGASPPAPPPRGEVLGIPLAISDYSGVIDWMQATIAAGGRATLTAAAVNLVMSAHEFGQTMTAVQSMTLVVPDGMPLVWALRALGHGEATRIYGPDLMLGACERAAREQIPVYLYGGRHEEGARELLARRLCERFPGLVIAGSHTRPFRTLTAAEEDEDVRLIDASGAQIVWVGTGQPRQELWMAKLRPRLSAPLLVGVGAAFDFHAGLMPQAPGWMQRSGLEWSYRLAHEPRRLWRRYTRYNPRFVAAFARQYARHLRAARG